MHGKFDIWSRSDDFSDMSAGLKKTRRLIKKAYDALKKGDIELSKKIMKRADQAAIDGMDVISEDDRGLDGEKIKPSWSQIKEK